MLRSTLTTAGCVLLLGLFPSRPVSALTEYPLPRPLAPAEVEAVALAAAYLQGGAPILWEGLAADSPLRRLGREAALAEIAVRTGPTEGVTWRLQTPAERYGPGVAIFTVELPSGLDDTLVFEMAEENGGWRLYRMRCLVDPGPEAREGPVRLGALAALREVIAGTRTGDLAALLRSLPAQGPVAEVAKLWQAQTQLHRLETGRAAQILAAVPRVSPWPLADVLRARLALIQNDWIAVARAYAVAVGRGWDHDGLRLEVALEQLRAGEITDDTELRQITAMGTRDPEAYWLLAKLALLAEDPLGPRFFASAWALRPIERKVLFGDVLLSYLSADPELFALLELGSPAEPRLGVPAAERRPVRLPAGARVFLSGQWLSVVVGSGKLEVPGGGRLAPLDVRPEPAGAEARREASEVLAGLDGLSETAANAQVLALPVFRRRVELAAVALAESRRWRELVRLTQGLETSVQHAGPTLGGLRARALIATDRDQEAQDLLLQLASWAQTQNRPEPTALLGLAELCADRERFDLAIRLLRRAEKYAPFGGLIHRIRQLELDQELATSYQSFESRHFDVRYPRGVDQRYPVLITTLLELERERLKKWIPVKTEAKVEVHLYPLQDFMDAYSGGVAVLGLFDGKLRLPFADLNGLHPILSSVITHELAHALIAELAGENVPRWFHEGLAQHVEPIQEVTNPLPPLAAKSRVIAFPLIEVILAGFSEPRFVGLAYDEAAWVLHFVEARHGVGAIHRLLDSFARGASTERALRDVFGQTEADFDRAFRAWGTGEAPVAWQVEEPDYDDKMIEKVVEMVPDLAHLLDGEPQDLPKMKRRSDAAVGGDGKPIDPRLAAMQEWHRYYSGRVAPVKATLGTVMAGMRGEKAVNYQVVCRKMSSEVLGVVTDALVFASADEEVNAALKPAFSQLQKMAAACAAGRTSELGGQLEEAERRLAQAAKLLAKYQLRP